MRAQWGSRWCPNGEGPRLTVHIQLPLLSLLNPRPGGLTNYSSTHSVIHPSVHSSIHPSTRPCIHESSSHPYVPYPSIHLPIRPRIHSSIYLVPAYPHIKLSAHPLTCHTFFPPSIHSYLSPSLPPSLQTLISSLNRPLRAHLCGQG